MEFGMMMPQHGHFATPANLHRMAKAAEDLGFDDAEDAIKALKERGARLGFDPVGSLPEFLESVKV